MWLFDSKVIQPRVCFGTCERKVLVCSQLKKWDNLFREYVTIRPGHAWQWQCGECLLSLLLLFSFPLCLLQESVFHSTEALITCTEGICFVVRCYVWQNLKILKYDFFQLTHLSTWDKLNDSLSQSYSLISYLALKFQISFPSVACQESVTDNKLLL